MESAPAGVGPKRTTCGCPVLPSAGRGREGPWRPRSEPAGGSHRYMYAMATLRTFKVGAH